MKRKPAAIPGNFGIRSWKYKVNVNKGLERFYQVCPSFRK